MELREIPKAALNFNLGQCVELKDNGDNAKTAPFKMNARTGDAINHWFWGKLVHDNEGASTHKGRVTIDYNHDANEVIGYANKIEVNDGDLTAKGVIQSYKEGDRAGEVIFRGKSGQPYEASISHDGDVVLEEVPEHFTVNVNGRDVEGPAVIVRQWNLRGIAVCPYGADKNTATEFNEDEKLSVKVIQMKQEQDIELSADADEVEVAEVELQATVEAEPVEVEVEDIASEEIQLAEEVEAVEAVEPSDDGEVELTDEVEATVEPVELSEHDDEPESETQDFNDSQVDAFAVLSDAFLELTEANEALNSENAELRTRLDALANEGEEAPVEFVAVASEDDEYAKKLQKYSQAHNAGVAGQAALIKIPQ